jgi:hypothetical protein
MSGAHKRRYPADNHAASKYITFGFLGQAVLRYELNLDSWVVVFIGVRNFATVMIVAVALQFVESLESCGMYMLNFHVSMCFRSCLTTVFLPIMFALCHATHHLRVTSPNLATP